MSRRLKPQKVEEWRHDKRGVTLDLFLDRNTHEFFFEFMRERYVKGSMSELKKLAHEVVERETSLTWIPMITVEKLEPFCQSDETFIGFTFDRSWIAQKVNGNWLEGRWEDAEKDATWGDREHWAHSFFVDKGVRAFSLPYYGDSKYYLPFTEALWVGLGTLHEHIKAMKKALNFLLTTPDGLRRVEQASSRLLQAGIVGLLPESEASCEGHEAGAEGARAAEGGAQHAQQTRGAGVRRAADDADRVDEVGQRRDQGAQRGGQKGRRVR